MGYELTGTGIDSRNIIAADSKKGFLITISVALAPYLDSYITFERPFEEMAIILVVCHADV